MNIFKRILPLFLAACFAFPASAAPLKILDADKEHFYQATIGSGSVASPYSFAITITDSMETSAEGNTGVKIFIQDQTTGAIDLYFHRELNTVTLASDSVVDAKTVTLNSGHGAATGNYLEFSEGEHVSQFEILGVATDVITLDVLMDHVYTSSASIQLSTVDMDVNGSVTPVIFQIDPIVGQEWDIVRIILVIEDDSAMDFSLFGSIAAVPNGVLFRRIDGSQDNQFSWKTNGDIINRCFDNDFQTNIGNNFRGFTVRCTYGGQSKRGVTLRLIGSEGDQLQIVIQDDLTTLSKVRVIAQGHKVQ